MKKWMVALMCLCLLALPLCALAEGLEIEYEEVAAVMAPEEMSDGEPEVFFEALEPVAEESGELTLSEDGIGVEAEETVYADFIQGGEASGESAVMSAEDDFVINEDGVLVWYNGPGGDVVIPNTVKSIRGGEFLYQGFRYDMPYCRTGAFEGSNISSVTIPDSVVSIGVWAFGGCNWPLRIL